MRTGIVIACVRHVMAASFLLALEGTLPALAQKRGTEQREVVYTCPMDKDVRAQTPGKCPKCGMDLRAVSRDPIAPRKEGRAFPNRREGRIDNLIIPDTSVYDQHGRQLRFYSDLVKGKTVAINFIFTTCTTICPPLTATFRRVQRNLGEREERGIELISVSVDPVVDIPERLKSWAQKFHAEAGWTFVTGSQAEIDGLLTALGAAVSDKNSHTPMVLIGNDQARFWTRAYGLASPDKLTKIIIDVASGHADEGK